LREDQKFKCFESKVLRIFGPKRLVEPVTVAEWSKVCTVFVLSDARIVGSNPPQGMDV
jgi:hypothetical protein